MPNFENVPSLEETNILSPLTTPTSTISSTAIIDPSSLEVLSGAQETNSEARLSVASVHSSPPPNDNFRPEIYWHEVAESIEPLRQGNLFTWVSEENGNVRLSEVFVYMVPGPPEDVKASILYWCPPATRSIVPGQSLRLGDVTEMLQGCPSSLRPSSSRTASKLIKNRCFTLFARKAAFPTLTMETEEKKICVLWLTCLHRVLINADRGVDGESRKKSTAVSRAPSVAPASATTSQTSHVTVTSNATPLMVATSPALSSASVSILPPFLRAPSRDKSLSASSCAQMSQLLEHQSVSPKGNDRISPSFFSRMLSKGRRTSSSRSSSHTSSHNSHGSPSPSRTPSAAASALSQQAELSSTTKNTHHNSFVTATPTAAGDAFLSVSSNHGQNEARGHSSPRNTPFVEPAPKNFSAVAASSTSCSASSSSCRGSASASAASGSILDGTKKTILRRESEHLSSEIPLSSKPQVLSGEELATAMERTRKGDGFVQHLSKDVKKAVSLYVRDNKLVCRSGGEQEALIPLLEGVHVYAGRQAFPAVRLDNLLSFSISSPLPVSEVCFSVVSPLVQLHLECSNLVKCELWMSALHTILLKQKATRAAVAAVKRDPNFGRILEFMKEGSIVTQYHIPTEGPPIMQTVMMFYSDSNVAEMMGNLFWVQPGTVREERSRNCFPVEHIMEITLGKASRALLTMAEKADDKCCFTISPAKGKSLNLEAESCGKRALWVQGINYLLTASKQVKKIPAKIDTPNNITPAEAQIFIRFQLVDGVSNAETICMWYRASTSRLGHLLWAVVVPLSPVASDAPPPKVLSPIAHHRPSPLSSAAAATTATSPSSSSSNLQLSLSSITEIILGSQTAGFGEVPVDPGCCFTILTSAHHSLELCAKSPVLRDIWLSQLHQLLTSSGVIAKKRPLHISTKANGGGSTPSSASNTPTAAASRNRPISSSSAVVMHVRAGSGEMSEDGSQSHRRLRSATFGSSNTPTPTSACSSSSSFAFGSSSSSCSETRRRSMSAVPSSSSSSCSFPAFSSSSSSSRPLSSSVTIIRPSACLSASMLASSHNALSHTSINDNESGSSGSSMNSFKHDNNNNENSCRRSSISVDNSRSSVSSSNAAPVSVSANNIPSNTSLSKNNFFNTEANAEIKRSSAATNVSPMANRIATPPKVSELKSAALSHRASDMLSRGMLFDEYVLDDRQGTTITEVTLCYQGPIESGQLIWGASRLKPSAFTNSIHIPAISYVSCGKTSPAFLSRGGRKAKDELCFAIHTPSVVLSLEADSRESRNLWLHNFQLLLTLAEKQIPFQTDDPAFGEPVSGSVRKSSMKMTTDQFGVVNEMPTVLMRSTTPNLAFDQQDPSLIFTVLAKIGQGSFGAVYRAQDRRDQRIVGLKLMECDADSTDEIQKEIKILQSCSSEYIVGLYGVYHKEASIWISMEYCAAGSLADMMTVCRQTLTEQQIAVVMRMALFGLKYLHSRQILHRDIKAANLLMTELGHCKLADFGVSAEISALTHRAQTVIGTPNWMAPEVIRASYYNDRADIWSLGITAIELAVGKPPHSEVQAMTAMFRIPTAPAPTLPNRHLWSANFHAFVEACLQKDFGLRPSAEVLLDHPFVAEATDIAPLKQFVDRCLLEMKTFRDLNEANQEHPNPLAEANNQDAGSSTLRYS